MFGTATKFPLVYDVPEYGLSFRFPEKLTTRMLTDFNVTLSHGRVFCKANNIPFETEDGYFTPWALAVITGAAAKAGLFLDWKCETLPDILALTEDDIDTIDLRVIHFVAPLVNVYIYERVHVPKVSFSKRVMQVLGGWKNRLN